MASALQILAPDGSVVGEAPGLPDAELKSLFVHMLRIRCMDGRMLKLQRAGRIGFVGTATGLEATLGTILTTDAYLASPTERDELAGEWGGLAVEMEGSALCGVAERFEVPWLVVRALSDRAGEDSLDDFAAFVDAAAANSAHLVRELLPVFD